MGLAPRGSRASAGQAKKDNITLTALPQSMVDLFRTRYTPVVRDFTGTIEVWKNPSNADIWHLANTVFDFDFQLQYDSELFTVLSKLVCSVSSAVQTANIWSQTSDRLSDWRTNFAKTAMAAVEKLFEVMGITETGERAALAKWLLGDSYRFRPFYYRKCRQGQEVKASGFQCASSPLFICSAVRPKVSSSPISWQAS